MMITFLSKDVTNNSKFTIEATLTSRDDTSFTFTNDTQKVIIINKDMSFEYFKDDETYFYFTTPEEHSYITHLIDNNQVKEPILFNFIGYSI